MSDESHQPLSHGTGQLPSPPPAPQGGASMGGKPTAVKVLQWLFYILGALTVLGSFVGFSAATFQSFISLAIGVGMIAAGWGMGKRMKWSWTVAMVILAINVLYSLWPVFSVLALVVSGVLLYFTWKQKEYFSQKA